MPNWAEFQQLKTPVTPSENEPEVFSAIGDTGQHWIARDCRNRPCLMIAVGAPAGQSESRLEYLRIQFSIPCEIQSPDGTARSTLTVLRCTSTLEEHQRLFVSLIDNIVAAVGTPATASKLQAVIRHLTAIFSGLTRPARTTIQGLWAELMVITSSRDPARLVRAWHATVSDDFDFSEGPARLEVKSTASHKREHSFTINQLQPPPGSTARIASVIVRPAGGGTNIASLVAEIGDALTSDPMSHLKLHALVTETLGAEWKDAADCRFDRELARSSLAFYDTGSVPQFVGELPIGVSHVSFISDLSRALPASIALAGSLFEAATPTRSARKLNAK
jgi:hypothetical protein